MHIFGLTGGIGSGKSTVMHLFRQRGIHTVDADDVARQVVEPGTPALQAIADHFGQAILLPNGQLDRAALRQTVFADNAQRRWLEQLLHPLIRIEMQRQLTQHAAPYALLVSPLLLETDQHQLVEAVIVIDVPEALQIERTVQRDGNDRAQVERILAAQISREQRLARASFVLDNTRAPDMLEQQVETLHRQLLNWPCSSSL